MSPRRRRQRRADRLGGALIPFLAVVVGLALLLLTIGAAFGAVVAIFQKGFGADLIIGILFGLAMDYQVFLVSRMREEHVHGAALTTAVTEGFRHGARVVTATALIMGAVFLRLHPRHRRRVTRATGSKRLRPRSARRRLSAPGHWYGEWHYLGACCCPPADARPGCRTRSPPTPSCGCCSAAPAFVRRRL